MLAVALRRRIGERWSTEVLMEKLHATGVKIGECSELPDNLEWVQNMKVVVDLESCTLPELRDALEWLSNRSQANRGTLALLNAPAAEEIIKKAKAMVENDAKDTKLQDSVQECLADTKDSLEHLRKLIKGAGDAAMFEVLGKGQLQQACQ